MKKIAFFAWCDRHSIRTVLHLTKILLNVTLVKEYSVVKKISKTCLSSAIYRVLGKEKHGRKRKSKRREKEQNFFLIGRFTTISPFFGHVSQLVQPTGFKLITSLSCVTCSTSPPLSHMCLYYIFLTQILYQTEFKLIV